MASLAESAFMKQLKMLIADFKDPKTGEILSQPLGRTIKKKLPEQRLKFIKEFITFILTSKFVSKETKYYISDRYITLEGVADYFNSIGDTTNKEAVNSNIWYNKNKITAAFDDRIILVLTEYIDTDISSYILKLHDLQNKFSDYSLLKNISLELPDSGIVDSTSEDDFNDFIESIQPYTKKHMKNVSELISPSSVGYAKYLLTSQQLTEDDKRRKERLMLFIEE